MKKTGLNSMLIISVFVAQIMLQYLIPVKKETIVAIIDLLTSFSAFVIIPLALILHSRHNSKFIYQIIANSILYEECHAIVLLLRRALANLQENKVHPDVEQVSLDKIEA
jgi:hypothetical protein